MAEKETAASSAAVELTPQQAAAKKEEAKHRLSLARKMRETAELLERSSHLSLRLPDPELREQFNERILTLVTTAIGVVAALFWQTAITDTIKTFIPVSGAWYYELLVAFIITVLGALIVITLNRPKKESPEKK